MLGLTKVDYVKYSLSFVRLFYVKKKDFFINIVYVENLIN